MLCVPLQGSLDNISIIIVCFPGAPQISQEALQQEAELEQQMDIKVGGDFLFLAISISHQKNTLKSKIYNCNVLICSLYRNYSDDEVQR